MIYKILIAEDDKGNMDLIRSYLNQSVNNFDILEAENGEELCKKSLLHEPDLILLDWELPIVNGLDALKYIKTQPTTKDIPVIMLSGENQPSTQLEEALNAGAIDFITFPFQKTELLARINLVFNLTVYNEVIKKRTEELNLERAKLQDLYREQDDLMSIVAHDLKAPLNKVLGLIQLMPLVGELNDEQQSYVDMIKGIVEGGRRLIDDILTINAYSYSEPLQLEEIQLGEYILKFIESYKNQAEKKYIRIFTEVNETIPLKVDVDCLNRIMDNLLSNALKFSNPGKDVYISAKSNNHYVHITVRDEGQGISKEDQRLMFKKFQRLSSKPTGGESSTGLGLSIIKALIEKLNGKITFKSELNVGTEFTFSLPQDSQ